MNKNKKIPLLAREDDSDRPYHDGVDDSTVVRATRVVWYAFALLAAFGAWAYFFEVDEVSNGTGKVIPTSREQIIQSLEGGIVTELNVSEGNIVKSGQVLARLDPTKTESNFDESAAKYRASLASVLRPATSNIATKVTMSTPMPSQIHLPARGRVPRRAAKLGALAVGVSAAMRAA